MELYDLYNDNNRYITWNFEDFFNSGENIYDFEYDFDLFELKNDSSYFIVFIPKSLVNENMALKKFIRKFKFQSFDNSAYNEIKSISYFGYLDTKIINIFYLDDFETLFVFFYNENELKITCDKATAIESGNGGEFDPPVQHMEYRRRALFIQKYRVDIYGKDLNFHGCMDVIEFNFKYNQLLYFKSIYLGKNYVIFSYIVKNNYNSIFFNVFISNK